MSPYVRRPSSTSSARIRSSTASIRKIIAHQPPQMAIDAVQDALYRHYLQRTAKSARVLFDESHGEAWTIRPDRAREMQPVHPADSSLATAAGALAEPRLRRRRPHRRPPHPRRPRRRRRPRHRPPLRPGVGGDRRRLPPLRPRRARRDRVLRRRRRRPRRPRRDRGGQVRHQPRRPPRPLRHPRREHHRPGLRAPHQRAPSWVLADLVRPDAGDGAPGPDLLAGVSAAAFYRAGTLESPTPTANGRSRPRPHLARPPARPAPRSPSPPTHGEGRVVRPRRLRPLRRRLHRRARPPRRSGSTSSTGSPAPPSARATSPPTSAAAASPAWDVLKQTVEVLRATQEPDGSVDLDRHDPTRDRPPHVHRIAGALGHLAPHFPHQDDYIDALTPTSAAGSRPDFAKPDFTRSLAAFRPERERARRHRAPRRLPDVQAERLPRHLLRGAHRPHPLARMARRARARPLRQPEVRPRHPRRLHLRLRLRVRRPLPRDRLHRRAPGEQLRRDLLRPRGRALPPRLPAAPPSIVRLNLPPDAAALLSSPEPLPRRLHPLGPRPRPHPLATATSPSTPS